MGTQKRIFVVCRAVQIRRLQIPIDDLIQLGFGRRTGQREALVEIDFSGELDELNVDDGIGSLYVVPQLRDVLGNGCLLYTSVPVKAEHYAVLLQRGRIRKRQGMVPGNQNFHILDDWAIIRIGVPQQLVEAQVLVVGNQEVDAVAAVHKEVGGVVLDDVVPGEMCIRDRAMLPQAPRCCKRLGF